LLSFKKAQVLKQRKLAITTMWRVFAFLYANIDVKITVILAQILRTATDNGTPYHSERGLYHLLSFLMNVPSFLLRN
jgi:hypothetical protein